jgi:hypothetical protein
MAVDIGAAPACTAVVAVGIAVAEVAGIAAGAVDIAGTVVVLAAADMPVAPGAVAAH